MLNQSTELCEETLYFDIIHYYKFNLQIAIIVTLNK